MLLSMLACLTATTRALTALSSPSCRIRPPVQRTRRILAQDGWITGIDQATGQTYYQDLATGQSQWEPPPQAASAQDGWITGVDQATGQTYYYNQATGESQWAPPSAVLWRLAGFAGVAGFSGVSGFAGAKKSTHYQLEYVDEGKPCQLPFRLSVGDEQVLSRWNMVEQKLTVSRVQATVKVLADGSAKLTSEGKGPTMWRPGGGPWYSLSTGEGLTLSDGDQVSLDCNDPEAAVFVCEAESAMQQGGYQQQGQGDYQQQGSYGQEQGGYGQQQGGYSY